MSRDNFNFRSYIIFSPILYLILTILCDNRKYIIESVDEYRLPIFIVFIIFSLINMRILNNKLRKLENEDILKKEKDRLEKIDSIMLEIKDMK